MAEHSKTPWSGASGLPPELPPRTKAAPSAPAEDRDTRLPQDARQPPASSTSFFPSGMKAYAVGVAVLLILGTLWMVMPGVRMLLIVSLIGLVFVYPMDALAMIDFPLAVACVISFGTYALLPRINYFLHVLGGIAVVGLGLLGMLAMMNGRIEATASDMLGSLTATETPPQIDITALAYTTGARRGDRVGECDLLCQQLLVSGAAERVFIASPPPFRSDRPVLPEIEGSQVAARSATIWELETRDACAPARLTPVGQSRATPEELDIATAAATLQRQGQCFVETTGTLRDATAILMTDAVGGARRFDEMDDLGEDAVTGQRLTLLQPDGETWRVTWQAAALTARFVRYPMRSTIHGNGFDTRRGFLTRAEPLGLEDISYDVILSEHFGVDLVVPGSLDRIEVLRAQLAEVGNGPVDPTLTSLASGVFEAEVPYTVDGADAPEAYWPLLLDMLATRNLPLPLYFGHAVPALDEMPEPMAAAFAEAAWARLDAAAPDQGVAANIILSAPLEAIEPLRADMIAMVDRNIRSPGTLMALARLPEFGPEGYEAFLQLWDMPHRAFGSASHGHYAAIMGGVCRAGAMTGPEARERMDRFASYGWLDFSVHSRVATVNALILLGYTDEEIRGFHPPFPSYNTEAHVANFEDSLATARAEPACG